MKKDRSEIALQWSETIKKQMLSEKPASVWCRENNIPYHTFLYWKKRFSPKPTQQINKIKFMELPQANLEGWLRISCRGIKLAINQDFDREALQYCLKILRDL